MDSQITPQNALKQAFMMVLSQLAAGNGATAYKYFKITAILVIANGMEYIAEAELQKNTDSPNL